MLKQVGPMATRSSPSKKRRSFERDREQSHESRKKIKDSSSAKREKTKHSRSSRKASSSKEKSSSGLRVRTVTELAALVASGAVRVPQGLQHYVSDRAQLLDQVFTILSPDDVTGMLPDVLKGLKMKQVKQLCLTKLESMNEDHIVSVIQSQNSSPESNLNQTIMKILDPSSSDSQPVNTEQRESGEKCIEDEERKEIEINVIDISDDDKEMPKVSEKCHSNKTIDSDNDQDSQPNTQYPLIHRTDSPSVQDSITTSQSSRSPVEQIRDESDSDIEQEDMLSVNQLLEMELRQKALESALKKANITPNHNTGTLMHKEQIVEDHKTLVDKTENHTKSAEKSSSHPSYNMDTVGQLLEKRLREKLLQSLAAKNK